MRSFFRIGLILLAVAIASAETARRQAPLQHSTSAAIESHTPHHRLPHLSPSYFAAAEALRRNEVDESLQRLESLSESEESTAETARLLMGLYLAQAEEYQRSLQLLETSGGAQHPLDDWRLFALAEAAAELKNHPTALDALLVLLEEHDDSTVRAAALVLGTELAEESGDLDAFLQWVERARRETLPLAEAEQIERFVWEMGERSQRIDLRQTAARRLLTDHPTTAKELGVIEAFDRDGQTMTLDEVLSLDALRGRARRLLDADAADSALATLGHVDPAARDLDWALLQAEALTEDHRGIEAYRLLQPLATNDRQIEAEINWHQARAALDAAKVRRGRNNLPQSDRSRMLQIGLQHLQRVVDLEVDPDASQRALKLMFAKLSDRDDFDAARTVLLALQEIDPTDTSGRRYLWRLGWQAYVERDYPRAIGYWSELESMYPETTDARSGRYWTGRAHEALGHKLRAREIFAAIVAVGVEDFYSRHARVRLSPDSLVTSAEPVHPTEPWPQDPRLERALWLSDVGLDRYALLELEAVSSLTERRAQKAAEAIVLARSGLRRDSIRALARAFPALGRPNQAIVPEDALRLYYPLDFRDIIERYATQRDLSPYLVFAMVRQESAFDVSAKSWAGARGLMQLMPATGRELAQRMGLRYSTERLNDPDFSVRLGTSYYSQVLDMFNGNHELALAGYNGGPYRIKKLWRQAGSDPELDEFLESLRLEETKTYVKRILLFENAYRRLYSRAG